jgi:thiamine pyrophosphokinase
MRAWIFGASQASAEDALFCKRIKFGTDDLIICADGGYNIVKFLGITPHIVIGDMDSVRGKVPSDVKTIVYPRNKDKTDLHLCIDYALEVGCNEIILLCCFGGRVDHSLAAIISLRYILERGAEGMLLTRNSKVFLIKEKTDIKRGEYTKLSLIPVTETVSGVTTQGLHYALDDAVMYQTANLGISNVFAGSQATVDIKEGILCVVCEID